jgi:hypothetical protein
MIRRFGGVTRDITRPVAEECTEGNRVAHGDQCCTDKGCPETWLTHADGTGVIHVERTGEGEGAQQEQQAGTPHGDLVDPQQETEAVDANGQHQDREHAVGQAQGQVGFRQTDQAFGATDQRIT